MRKPLTYFMDAKSALGKMDFAAGLLSEISTLALLKMIANTNETKWQFIKQFTILFLAYHIQATVGPF